MGWGGSGEGFIGLVRGQRCKIGDGEASVPPQQTEKKTTGR